MKTKASELKRRAKKSLQGNYGVCVGGHLVIYAVLMLFMVLFTMALIAGGFSGRLRRLEYYSVGIPSGIAMVLAMLAGYFLVFALIMMVMFGIIKMIMNISLGQKGQFSDILFAFGRHPLKFLGMYLCEIVIGLLPGIPYFVVFCAGVVTDFIPVIRGLQALTYVLWLAVSFTIVLNISQAVMILLEDPEKKIFQCFRESIAMMKGNKGRLFYLYLSFIGIMLLGYLSFGIALLWILPYMTCTSVHFYLDLKAGMEPSYSGGYVGDPYTVHYEEVHNL